MRSRLRHAMPSDLVKWANEWRRGCGEDEGERACSRGAHTCGTSARVVTAHPGELCVSTAYAGNNRVDSVMAYPVQLAEAGWGRPICADCAPIAGGVPHLAGIAHELILHVRAAGGEPSVDSPRRTRSASPTTSCRARARCAGSW